MENEIGDWIRQNRKKIAWTQKELADKIYVNEKTIGRWERGEFEPSTQDRASLENTFRKELQEEVVSLPLIKDVLFQPKTISDEASLARERKETPRSIPASSTQSLKGWKFRWSSIFLVLIIIAGVIGVGVISHQNSTSRWWPVVDAVKDQAPYQSSRIKLVQWMLVFHKQPKTQTSYLPLIDVDGFAGLITQHAVKRFQTDTNLLSTGIVDKPTWEKLLPISQENNNGEQVKALQEILNVNPFSVKLVVDGVYGPLTEQAVEQFQARVGLHKTGIADLDTWCILVGGQLKES